MMALAYLLYIVNQWITNASEMSKSLFAVLISQAIINPVRLMESASGFVSFCLIPKAITDTDEVIHVQIQSAERTSGRTPF